MNKIIDRLLFNRTKIYIKKIYEFLDEMSKSDLLIKLVTTKLDTPELYYSKNPLYEDYIKTNSMFSEANSLINDLRKDGKISSKEFEILLKDFDSCLDLYREAVVIFKITNKEFVIDNSQNDMLEYYHKKRC